MLGAVSRLVCRECFHIGVQILKCAWNAESLQMPLLKIWNCQTLLNPITNHSKSFTVFSQMLEHKWCAVVRFQKGTVYQPCPLCGLYIFMLLVRICYMLDAANNL